MSTLKIKRQNDIKKRRQHERQKYIWLQRHNEAYGHGFYGKNALVEILKYKPKVLIDLGCGNNDFCRQIRKYNIAAFGIDFVYKQADFIEYIHDTKLKSDSCDFVTAFDSLQNCLESDISLIFLEIKRILKKDGHFCFSINQNPSKLLVQGENLHPTVNTISWWIYEIEKAGGKMTKFDRGFLYGKFSK